MENQYSIRPVEEGDVAQVLSIYSFFVRETVISFEYDAPVPKEFLQRVRTVSSQFPWLVCLSADSIIGFAYASSHRQRKAYQWSCESSVYLLAEFHRKGIAKILYQALFSLLRLQGYYNVYAGVSLPNEKSVGFHRAFGFKEVGVYKNIGYKLGEWHDVQWFQLCLQRHPFDPPEPKSIGSVRNTETFKQIIALANGDAQKINPG